jgi:hypothetical protein
MDSMLDILVARANEAERLRQAAQAARLHALTASQGSAPSVATRRRWPRLIAPLRLLIRGT